MFKKMVMVLVLLALTLGLSGIAMAGEKTDALSATVTGLDWVSDLTSRLIENGEPAVVFGKNVEAALKTSLVENFLGKPFDIVAGMTLANDEPSNFIWGVEYTGWTEKSGGDGGIWGIFSQIKIGAYNERGEWKAGLAYVWRV